MTPKTLRVPKPGEMLLSVHGSPLGVYKEENMEAIHGMNSSHYLSPLLFMTSIALLSFSWHCGTCISGLDADSI